jgi:sugar phosphate isomerase/epimerase
MKERMTGFADEAASSIEGQVAVLRQLNWNSIELRTVDNTLAHDLPEDSFNHVLSVLENNEIRVSCLGSGIANWGRDITCDFNETKEIVHRTIKRMKQLNTHLVRIMSYKIITDNNGRIALDQHKEERFNRLRWICGQFLDNGITPVHENCFNYGGLSYEHSLEMLEAVPGLRLVFDTGNAPLTIDGRKEYPYPVQNSFEFYHHVKDYIDHVHIKDSVLDQDGKTEHYFYPGEGNGDVIEIVKSLELLDGYKGLYSIEPHMEVVFHDATQQSSETKRIKNFVTYGEKFEEILHTVYSPR